MEKIKEMLSDRKVRFLVIVGSIIIVAFIVLCIVLGFSNKTEVKEITCNYNSGIDSESKGSYIIKYNVTNNEIDDATASTTYFYDTKEEVEFYSKNDICSQFTTDSGMYNNCSSRTEDTKIIVDLVINLDYVSPNEGTENLFLRRHMSLDEVKNYMNEKDYTCNID